MNIIFADLDMRIDMFPLALTRHCADLRVGILTLREKWERHLDLQGQFLTENYLQSKYPLSVSADNLLINPLALPNAPLLAAVQELGPGQVLTKHDVWVAARLTSVQVERYNQEGFPGGEKRVFDGTCVVLKHPWDLFANNAAEIEADYELLTQGRKSALPHESATLLGDRIFIEPGAEVINCSLNSLSGPIYIGKDASVLDGAFIRGPFALCEHGTVNMGAKIRDASTIGPWCKVGGEVNNSIMIGYSNKGHDGFMGNSVIGEWCNLGADTNTSNLKNNYGQVRAWSYRHEKAIDTGRQFCGLIMGDHSKCGINTMFNTGTVVGVSSNIYGGDFPPKFIPSFSWGGADGFVAYQTNKAYETAERVMGRRGRSLSRSERQILDHIFQTTSHHRSQDS